jgi:tRNA threonylcarbamoyladenosine biosynthesis protein TsaB
MKTLALDTSLSHGSVAAVSAGRVAVRSLPTAVEHARLLAAAVADVAGELGWRPADAELVAVVRGPGSFTGLRVGVTTAKAICWTSGARLLGVSAVEVIAHRAAAATGRSDIPVAVAFDAGRGEVFAAVAEPAPGAAGGWRIADGVLAPAGAWLAGLAPGTVVSGPGLAMLGADVLAARPDLAIVSPDRWTATAADVAEVALLHAAAGEHDDPATLVPDYIRPSYADEKR